MLKRYIIIPITILAFLFILKCDEPTDPSTSSYKVTISSSVNGSVSPSGDTTVSEGTSLSITATPNTKYHFLTWSVTGNITITTNSATGEFTVNGEGTIIADFEIDINESLPTDNSVTGWVIEDNSCFEGVAKNTTKLYEIIDGGADVYIDNGFFEAAFKGYTDGTIDICAYIYNENSNTGSMAVYNHPDIALGEYETVSNLGDAARIDTSNQFSYELELVKGKYYITIFSDQRIDSIKATLKSFGAFIVNKISKK